MFLIVLFYYCCILSPAQAIHGLGAGKRGRAAAENGPTIMMKPTPMLSDMPLVIKALSMECPFDVVLWVSSMSLSTSTELMAKIDEVNERPSGNVLNAARSYARVIPEYAEMEAMT